MEKSPEVNFTYGAFHVLSDGDVYIDYIYDISYGCNTEKIAGH